MKEIILMKFKQNEIKIASPNLTYLTYNLQATPTSSPTNLPLQTFSHTYTYSYTYTYTYTYNLQPIQTTSYVGARGVPPPPGGVGWPHWLWSWMAACAAIILIAGASSFFCRCRGWAGLLT